MITIPLSLPPAPPRPTEDVSKYAVLVPFYETVRHETEECLRGVERLGIPVVRQPGCSAIDFARCQMASGLLIHGCESMLFVDSDIVFKPEDALKLLRRPEPVVAGMYVQKEFNNKINVVFLDPVPSQIPMGTIGRDFLVKNIAAGFLRIRREALLTLVEQSVPPMPVCTTHGGRVWPFFLPKVIQESNLEWGYRSEDYAFCERCLEAGIPMLVDTTIDLGHIGTYVYRWEDATRRPPEHNAAFTMDHVVIPRG